MGYFSNGSEGDHYQAAYCDNCAQWKERESDPAPGMGPYCPVWAFHITHVGDEARQHDLDLFIPRRKGKWDYNTRCAMFVPRDASVMQGVLEFEAAVAAYQHEPAQDPDSPAEGK